MNSFGIDGGSVYLLISRINHSCSPNCLHFKDKDKLNIRSINPIPAGTEITIFYIYLYYP